MHVAYRPSLGPAALVFVLILILYMYFWACFQHCCARCISKRWTSNVI